MAPHFQVGVDGAAVVFVGGFGAFTDLAQPFLQVLDPGAPLGLPGFVGAFGFPGPRHRVHVAVNEFDVRVGALGELIHMGDQRIECFQIDLVGVIAAAHLEPPFVNGFERGGPCGDQAEHPIERPGDRV